MNIEHILAQVDALFEENQGEEAEKLMQESLAEAVGEQDDNSILQLLNELLGYYRETSRYEEAYLLGERAIAQAERMGLKGTIPYATTLLNVANVYRAGGRLEDSLKTYLQVQDIYGQQLSPDNMFVAGLQNNLSLLYQEMGEYEKAKECQLKALQIVKNKDAAYELGVTYANLAATCVQLGQLDEADEYADRSMETFNGIGVCDSHYGAALSAKGAAHYQRQEYGEAAKCYRRAMEIVEQGIGRNQAYYRLKENAENCEKACGETEQGENRERINRADREQVMSEKIAGTEAEGTGIMLSRAYYETYGVPMIREKFPEYEGRIAVGLAGRGSDCFGYDDGASRDHDWGPDFCMWVTDETYEEIGEKLQEAYDALPEEFQGYRRAPHVNGKNRRGVIRISDFYRSLLGTDSYEKTDWRSVSDASLAAAVNGQVFRDEEGIFSGFRNKLLQGYPEEILYLKVAEAASKFAQTAEYNFSRMYERGDRMTARMMLWDGIKEAMRLQLYLDGKYPPHDKWLHRSLLESEEGQSVAKALDSIGELSLKTDSDFKEIQQRVEELGDFLAREMYRKDIISDIDSYLDAHSEELVYKASLSRKSNEELVEDIAKLEFEAFDKVHNEGGRASCQNDWFTFSIMRKSQYLTWNRTMLLQYLYDFHREFYRGHNLIEEKYGRMMESTAPEKYEEIKSHFPELAPEKRSIIEQICGLQVKWMEEFAAEYPALADNARSIHTSEDNPFNTSYETYLRGELGTYSDKMLELYGRYIVSYAAEGKNPAYDIMGNSVRMYGYKDIEEAEKKTKEAWG
ncbi:MAG: DUF4125 family protein [Lachnospiraceae bacterium]|nr:DUF4125 family protein [Lachnospiraceae bacterium]